MSTEIAEQRQCGHLDKDTGMRCAGMACNNSRGCEKHGGLTGNRYKSVLPARMFKSYEEGFKEPKLLDLIDDIEVAEKRTEDLMKRVDKGESGALWAQLLEMAREYEATRDPELVNSMVKQIKKGHQDYRTWAEIKEWQKHKQSLVESQTRLKIQLNQVVSLAQVLGIIAKVGLLFERYVQDKSLRTAMSKEIGNLIDIKPMGATIPVYLEEPKD